MFFISIKCQFLSMKTVKPCDLWSLKLVILPGVHARIFQVHGWSSNSLGFPGRRKWDSSPSVFTSVSGKKPLSTLSERASTSLFEGSLDVRTHNSSLPNVESWHLFQKMPNVFSLHICCHISDLSLVRSLWEKKKKEKEEEKKNKKANKSVCVLLPG